MLTKSLFVEGLFLLSTSLWPCFWHTVDLLNRSMGFCMCVKRFKSMKVFDIEYFIS